MVNALTLEPWAWVTLLLLIAFWSLYNAIVIFKTDDPSDGWIDCAIAGDVVLAIVCLGRIVWMAAQ